MRSLVLAAALYAATFVSLAAQAPAGRTVWDGVFTHEQADRGGAAYAASCARCHGRSLEGGMGASLVGTPFWNKWRQQSVEDLLGYVTKNMPMGRTADSLSPAEYADIVAYVLRSNDLPAGNADLTLASGTGVMILPKDGGSGELAPGTLARVIGCLAPQDADRGWHIVGASRPDRVKSIEGTPPPGAPGGDRRYVLKFVLQPLAALVGQRIAVVGLLLGEGGADGINVSTVQSLAVKCD